MKGYHLCSYDPELFRKVREGVSMRQVVEYCGIQVNRKGLCLCPFHHDTDPSLRIYPNGKGFYCFTCGTGGDQIKFTALYRGISNAKAAGTGGLHKAVKNVPDSLPWATLHGSP